ncbi:hypothetical protein [Rubritalea tangerina]|uniref:hypothetical protein n=1 Tax=Rubritalea tangerina TaxID=430798 RepID=UPI00361F7108
MLHCIPIKPCCVKDHFQGRTINLGNRVPEQLGESLLRSPWRVRRGAIYIFPDPMQDLSTLFCHFFIPRFYKSYIHQQFPIFRNHHFFLTHPDPF